MSFSPIFRRSLAISAALALAACSSTTPPATLTVLSTSPAMGAANVAVDSDLTVVFNGVPSSATLTLSPSVDVTPAFHGAQVTWTHATAFAAGTQYTATLSAAASAGGTLPLASSVSWSFTTVSAPDTTPPSQITDLAASNATMTTVALSWTAPGNDGDTGTASAYSLKYASGAGCPLTAANFSSGHAISTTTPKAAGSAESAIASGLAGNTTYCFGIEASDRAGNVSPLSNIATATTTTTADVTPPAAVTNLAATATGVSTIHVTWTAPADDSGNVASYDLRQGTGAGCPITAANFAGSTSITTTTPKAAGGAEAADSTGLFANTAYCYAIKSTDGAGNVSALSNVATATTQSPPAGAISNLFVQAVSGEQVTLTFSAPVHNGTGTYDLYTAPGACPADSSTFIASATGHLANLAASASGTTESETVTALNPSSQYCFGVTFTGNGATTAISNLVSADTGDDLPPAKITLAVGTLTASSVSLSFTAPGDNGTTGNTVTSYDLRYATTATDCTAFNFNTATKFATHGPFAAPGATQTFNVTGLASSTHYCFAITATDAATNTSAVSATASATTPAPDNNAPPNAVTDLAVSDSTNTTIQLSFTAPGQHADQGTVASYDLRYQAVANDDTGCDTFDYATATPATFTDALVAAGGTQTANITGLSKITAYCFALTASDGNGHTSLVSNLAFGATVDQSPPDVPALTLVGTPSDHEIMLSTTAPNANDLTPGAAATAYDLRYLTGADCDAVAPAFNTGTQVNTAAPGTPGTTDTFDLTNLPANTNFCFGLAAIDSTGNESAYSDKLTASTGADATAPGAVTNLALVPDGNKVTLTFTLTGDDGAVGSPAATQLYALTGAACPITAANFGSATLVDSNTNPGAAGSEQSYEETTSADVICYAVTVSDAAGNVSDASNSALYVQNGPTAPASFAATSVGTTSLTLSWLDGSGDGTSIPAATSYTAGYEAAADCSAFTFAGSVGLQLPAPQASGTAETFPVTGLSQATSYCFGLAGVDQFGNVSPIATVAVTTQESGTTGIAAVRAAIAAAGATPVTFPTAIAINNAVVSYVKTTAPAGAAVPDSTGFFIQSDTGGPALYISIDPATFLNNATPALAPGDVVNLSVTTGAWSDCTAAICNADNSEYIVTAATGARVAQGAALPGAIDLNTTSVEIPASTPNWQYDDVLVSGPVTLTGVFTTNGTGFEAAAATTPADPSATDIALRVPTTVVTAAGLEKGCTVTLINTPMGRFATSASSQKTELGAYVASDFIASCPPPTLTASTPADGSTGSALTPTLSLTFDTPMIPTQMVADTTGGCTGNVTLATQATPGTCIALPALNANATDNVFTAAGALSLALNTTYVLTITGAEGNNGQPLATKTITFTTEAVAADCTHVVISQVYGAGGNSGATDDADFVELHNNGSVIAGLGSCSLQYNSATSTTAPWEVAPLSGTIPPGGYFLVQASAVGSKGIAISTPDLVATPPLNLAAGAGKIVLVNSGTAITGSCPTGAPIVDFVGFGATANCFEGTGPTPAPSTTVSVVRAGNGCTDTNQNATDFSTNTLPATVGAAGSARNSSTTPVTCQ